MTIILVPSMYPVQISAIGGTSRWVNLAQIRELEFFPSEPDPRSAWALVVWQTGDRERFNGQLAHNLYDRWRESSCRIAARFPEPTQPEGQASIDACPPDESC
ncbi:MAG: hypothetical protein HC925_00045 [Coleofasciculaceae cyanobacterium SM2_3_26]|nr:hypothetical protein [Coleofasciculaceae cyanobacterium SM2_3_26]